VPRTATLPAPTPVPTFAPPFATVGELLRRLGDVSPDRVRADPPPGTATEADLLREENEKPICELIDGTLVEKAMGNAESFLAMTIIVEIGIYLKMNPLGYLGGEAFLVRVGKTQVRAPDVAVTLWKAGQPHRVPREAIADTAPALVVEVLSPSNTKAEIARKLAEFFAAGTLVAWVVDSQTGTAEIYTTATDKVTVTRDGVLTAEAVLPGFALPLAVVFAHGPDLDEPG
jgi:Uma2 family endonuclease